MKTTYKIGDRVRVSPDNDNENYDSFRNKVLTVSHVATNSSQHPGFDSGVNQALYDFKGINCSLYEYELIPA